MPLYLGARPAAAFQLSDEASAIACRVPPGQRSEVGACDRALTTDFHKNLYLEVKSKSYKMRIYSLADRAVEER